jgi:hypothetical protein
MLWIAIVAAGSGGDAPGFVAGEQMRARICCDATLLKFNFAPWEQIVQRCL